MKKTIVIATIKKWNIINFFKLKEKYENQYSFHLITNNNELTKELIDNLQPKYIFFLHWSWIIPKNIYSNFECVVFHMTDLPFGRGGSPLQNLLINGIYNTKISAIKVSKNIDAGDIYIKKNLNIKKGSAKKLFKKASKITYNKIIPEFLEHNLIAKKQIGKVVNFKRRKPEQSDLLSINYISLTRIYDFIRMLDAQGYPNAFIKLNNTKIKFKKVKYKKDKLIGKFEVINE